MKGLLLDTHALIWFISDPKKLLESTYGIIADPSRDIYLSSAAIWEISIKRALGRLETPDNLLSVLDENKIEVLNITGEHALGVASLPLIHQDPFDRMQIVQAQKEGLILVTRDKKIKKYQVETLDC